MYQALYRKYRPRTFSDVVGQEHITVTLRNQVAGDRLSHAYLFIGTRGTGKTSCAKILSRAVNCLSPENGDPCNKCSACLEILDGSILDVVELDAASNNGVDNVRALRDEAKFSPASVRKRVYIVDEVHMLSTAAFNALLKILEEPPEHLMFILATTELHKVPATILSRCQRHSFRRIGNADIAGLLERVAEKEQIPLTAEAGELLARLADGSLRDALSLLDQCAAAGGTLDEDAVLSRVGLSGSRKTAELFEKIQSGDVPGALALFDGLWQAGRAPQTILSELAALARDVLITIIAPRGGAALLSGAFDAALLKRLATLGGAARFTMQLEVLEAADTRLSSNPRLTAELAIMRLANPSLAGDLPALERRVGTLEERLRQGIAFSPAGNAPHEEAAAPAPPVITEETPGQDDEYEEPDDDSPPWIYSDEPEPDFEAEPLPEPLPEFEPAPEPQPEPVTKPAPEPPPISNQTSGPELRAKLIDALPPGADVGSVMIMRNHSLCGVEAAQGRITLTVETDFAYNLLNSQQFLAAVREAAGTALGAGATVQVERGEIKKEAAPKRSLDELARLGNVVFED